MEIRIHYRELGLGETIPDDALSLIENINDTPQDNEEEIALYLENAPNYCAVGRIVGDVLNPHKKVVLFPGSNTDGMYIWQSVLPYYVREYHLKLPDSFVRRMESRAWQPPSEAELGRP